LALLLEPTTVVQESDVAADDPATVDCARVLAAVSRAHSGGVRFVSPGLGTVSGRRFSSAFPTDPAMLRAALWPNRR
jgi:hypothetical protein